MTIYDFISTRKGIGFLPSYIIHWDIEGGTEERTYSDPTKIPAGFLKQDILEWSKDDDQDAYRIKIKNPNTAPYIKMISKGDFENLIFNWYNHHNRGDCYGCPVKDTCIGHPRNLSDCIESLSRYLFREVAVK